MCFFHNQGEEKRWKHTQPLGGNHPYSAAGGVRFEQPIPTFSCAAAQLNDSLKLDSNVVARYTITTQSVGN